MLIGKAAVRYAKSLLALATERGQVDEVQRDMEVLHQAIDDSRELELLLKSPVVKADRKEKILAQVFEGKLSELSMGFINICVRKGREDVLAACAVQYIQQAKKAKRIFEASVTSAAPLDDATRAKVKAIVDDMCEDGGTTELVENVDPELIGGFIIRFGDQMIDASVRSGIRGLRRDFSENPYVPEF